MVMVRIFNALLLSVMIIGAGITYDMKHRAEEAANRVAGLKADIARERDAVSVLKAEWSMLSQPGRLQTVVARYADHFKLAPFSAAQVATLQELPMKPVDAVPAADARALADKGLTKIIQQAQR
jgi:hypothetical protein